MRSSFITLYNGASVPRRDVPQQCLSDFLQSILDASDRGWRVCAYFAARDGHLLQIYCLLASKAEGKLALSSTAVTGESSTAVTGESIPSLALLCPQVSLFEREMAEQ